MNTNQNPLYPTFQQQNDPQIVQNQFPSAFNQYPCNANVIPLSYQQQQHYMHANNDPFYNPYFNQEGKSYENCDKFDDNPSKSQSNFNNNQANLGLISSSSLKAHDFNMNFNKYMVFFQYDSVNVFAFDFETRSFIKCPNYYNFKLLSYFRVVQTPEYTFILTGGCHSDNVFSNSTYHYNNGYFQKQKDMPTERRAHCSVYHEGYVYVFGGMNSYGQTKNCERFHVINNKWERIAPLTYERTLASCCLFGKDLIYVLGGYNERMNKDLIEIECYNIRTNSFGKANCFMPAKIENPIVTQINEREIAIMGGFCYEKGEDTDEVYVVNVDNGNSVQRGKVPKACWSAYCHPYLIRPDTFLIFFNGEDEFRPSFCEVTLL